MQPNLRQTRHSLTRRYGALVSLLVSGFALVAYQQVRTLQVTQQRRQVEQLAATAAGDLMLLHHEFDEMRRDDVPTWLREQAHLAFHSRPAVGDQNIRIRWFDDQLVQIKSHGSFQPSGRIIPSNTARATAQWLPVSNGLGLWRPVLTRSSRNAPPHVEGYVSVVLSSATADAELTRLRRGLVLGALVAGLIGFMASQWVVAASLDPVRRQVERLIRFTADASHELRHPLTAVRALIGSLRHGGHLSELPSDVLRKLEQIDQSTVRMGRLVDDLLLLTRTDRVISDISAMVPFPLDELLEDLVELHQAEAAAAGVSLQAQIDGTAMVNGHPDSLRRLFENLLSNALRFSPQGSQITLGLTSRRDRARVWMDDQGPGIPPEHRKAAFERFWQADQARSNPENHGLGLAIAQAIAQAHNGHLQALEAPGGGCRMQLDLPLIPT